MEPRFSQGKQVLESSLVSELYQSSSLGSIGIVMESASETTLSSRLAQLRRLGPSCHLWLHLPYRTHESFLQVCEENRTHTCLHHPECPDKECVVRLGGKT